MTSGDGPQVLLELEAVTRTFGDSDVGVHDATLTVSRGDFVAITGASGAGKSTLLNILGLLDRPDSGRYVVAGVEVSTLTERGRDRLRGETFGFVFQEAHVLGNESVLTNAALGLRTQGANLLRRSIAANRALQRVRLTHRARYLAKHLSGGERQRLAIARAVASEPLVILADEPTGNLDSVNGNAVLALLHELHDDGATIILITHDERIAATAQRRWEIVDGVLTERACANAAEIAVPASPDERRQRHCTSRRGLSRRNWGILVDDFADALRGSTQRVLRTGVLLLAFALGVGGLVGALGASETAAAQVSQRLTEAALDEVRVVLPVVNAAGNAAVTTEYIDRALEMPHVLNAGAEVVVGAQSAGVSRFADQQPLAGDFSVMAASNSYLEVAEAHVTPESGHLLDTETSVALVGADLAERLGVAPPGPGSTLWVNGRQVDVVGIVAPGSRIDLGDSLIVSPDVVTGLVATTSIVVRTEFGYPAAVAEALPVALDAANPGQFDISTVADLRNLRFGVANDLGVFVAVVGGIILLLAMLGASATMYISVQSRTPEIALRRALGASRGAIARLFIWEGAIVGLVGGSVGGLIGLVAVFSIAAVSNWSPVLPPGLSPIAVGIGLVAGIFSALVPAIRASLQQPALAIRGAN